jgi:hypothetical protein
MLLDRRLLRGRVGRMGVGEKASLCKLLFNRMLPTRRQLYLNRDGAMA